jgi:hypothetical protein
MLETHFPYLAEFRQQVIAVIRAVEFPDEVSRAFQSLHER